MSTSIIPISNAGTLGAFTMTVMLTGVDFQLAFRFNEREGCWYFDLMNSQGIVIRSGIKIVVNFPLLSTIVDLGRPAGELVVVDTREPAGQSDPLIGLNDLGITALLGYIDNV